MFRRFTTFQRILHGIMILSFFTLAITGMALKFSYMGWAQATGAFLGGFAVTGALHRLAAIALTGIWLTHIFDVVKKKRASGKSWIGYIFDARRSLMFSVQDLKDRCRAFCEARDWAQYHTPKELAIGLATEAAELLQRLRFKSDDEVRALAADPKRREGLAHEVADTLYFLLRFCEVSDIDVADALEAKLKVNEGKYPAEKVRGRNERYDEY